jgi:hypothetical protein
MSKILPDNRIMWIVGIIAVILIPVFGKFREIKEASSEISAEKKQTLPVYFPAGDVKYYSRGDSITGVFYSTKLPFSKQASEVILEFYDIKTKQLGLKPFVEDYYKYADRKWSDPFIDETKKDNPNIVQLNAS